MALSERIKKTREEVESLKQNWLNDPCFKLEEVKGFEEYIEELHEYSEKITKEADERYKKLKIHLDAISSNTSPSYYERLVASVASSILRSGKIDVHENVTAVFDIADLIILRLAQRRLVK